MDVKQADIGWLIDYLNSDTDVDNIIDWRLYRNIPMKMPWWIYMIVSPRLEYQQWANKQLRLRFRCVGNTEIIKHSELHTLMAKTVNALSWKALTNRYWFGQSSTYFEDYIDWNRPMLEFSMFCYYTY